MVIKILKANTMFAIGKPVLICMVCPDCNEQTWIPSEISGKVGCSGCEVGLLQISETMDELNTEVELNTWEINGYKGIGLFGTDVHYKALIGKDVCVKCEVRGMNRFTSCMISIPGHEKTFPFCKFIDIVNMPKKQAEEKLRYRKKLILEWIESLNEEENRKFEI